MIERINRRGLELRGLAIIHYYIRVLKSIRSWRNLCTILLLMEGEGRGSHTYVIKSSFEESTKSATNFCSLEWGLKQQRPCSSRTQEGGISNPIRRNRSFILLVNFTIFLSTKKKSISQ